MWQRKTAIWRFFCLDDPSCFESCVRSVLVDRLDRSCREGESDVFLHLRDVNPLWLKVEISAYFAGRVELSRTGAVRVSSSHKGSSFCNWAGFCHKSNENMLSRHANTEDENAQICRL